MSAMEQIKSDIFSQTGCPWEIIGSSFFLSDLPQKNLIMLKNAPTSRTLPISHPHLYNQTVFNLQLVNGKGKGSTTKRESAEICTRRRRGPLRSFPLRSQGIWKWIRPWTLSLSGYQRRSYRFISNQIQVVDDKDPVRSFLRRLLEDLKHTKSYQRADYKPLGKKIYWILDQWTCRILRERQRTPFLVYYYTIS